MSFIGDLLKAGINATRNLAIIGGHGNRFGGVGIPVYSAAALAKGDLVFLSGLDSTSLKPAVTVAEADVTDQVATHVLANDIAAGGTGIAYTQGLVTGTAGQVFDTSSFTAVGQKLYLSDTGNTLTCLTETAPGGGDSAIQLVGVLRVKSATVGSVYYNIGGGSVQELGSAQLDTDSVDSDQIAASAVDTAELAASAVETAKINDDAVTSAKVEEGLLQYTDTQLTHTNIGALVGTPITVVAAPGANKAIIVHKYHIVADCAAGAYAEPSAPDDLVLEYADGTDITGIIEATALLVNAGVQVITQGVLDTVVVPDVNAVVRLLNSGGDYTSGNAANTLSIRVWYSVVDTIAFT